MPKVEIHLEINIPSEHLDVNQIVALFQEVQAQLGLVLASRYLEEVQDQVLSQTLNPKWLDAPQERAPWECPRCEARLGFKRRGSRPRVLRRTSLGRVPFDLRQVTCGQCGATFSPFSAWFGLAPYQVSTSEFQAKAVEVACQESYARSVAYIRKLGGVPISATAVHSWVQNQGGCVAFDESQADDRPVLLDSTLVRAGGNKRGCHLNLGISIEGRYWARGRPRLRIHPVCFGVGQTWSQTGQALAMRKPARLVYDGDGDVTQWAERTFPNNLKQRCVWHATEQLYRNLWEDGLNRTRARKWMRELGQIIYYPKGTVRDSHIKVSVLINQLRERGLSHGALYLEGAAPYLFTYREQPDGMFFDEERREPLAISTTSPVERQIREINRRTDLGARWSILGVQNLIGLDLVRRFDPEQWRELWHLPQRDASAFSIAKLHMRVLAESPNVKTT